MAKKDPYVTFGTVAKGKQVSETPAPAFTPSKPGETNEISVLPAVDTERMLTINEIRSKLDAEMISPLPEREMETLLDLHTSWPPKRDGGLLLQEALQESTFLHRAARPLEGGYLLSDGIRFWKADAKMNGVDGIFVNQTEERSTANWRPVRGDETGWRIA